LFQGELTVFYADLFFLVVLNLVVSTSVIDA